MGRTEAQHARLKRVLVVDQILGEQVHVLALGVRNLDDELLDLEHPEVLGLLVLGHVEPAVEVVDQRLGLVEAEEQVVAFFGLLMRLTSSR